MPFLSAPLTTQDACISLFCKHGLHGLRRTWREKDPIHEEDASKYGTHSSPSERRN
jgi:hypothetical protein